MPWFSWLWGWLEDKERRVLCCLLLIRLCEDCDRDKGENARLIGSTIVIDNIVRRDVIIAKGVFCV